MIVQDDSTEVIVQDDNTEVIVQDDNTEVIVQDDSTEVVVQDDSTATSDHDRTEIVVEDDSTATADHDRTEVVVEDGSTKVVVEDDSTATADHDSTEKGQLCLKVNTEESLKTKAEISVVAADNDKVIDYVVLQEIVSWQLFVCIGEDEHTFKKDCEASPKWTNRVLTSFTMVKDGGNMCTHFGDLVHTVIKKVVKSKHVLKLTGMFLEQNFMHIVMACLSRKYFDALLKGAIATLDAYHNNGNAILERIRGKYDNCHKIVGMLLELGDSEIDLMMKHPDHLSSRAQEAKKCLDAESVAQR